MRCNLSELSYILPIFSGSEKDSILIGNGGLQIGADTLSRGRHFLGNRKNIID